MALLHGILQALFPPRAEPIGELVYGRQVTVRGQVIARDLLESPLTREPCVYYRYAVEEWRQSRLAGLPEGYWHLIARDEAIAEFYLQDDSGRAIVAPQFARIDRARGVEPATVDTGNSRQRAQELLIRPGDIVEVTAVAETVDDLYDDARDYRQVARRTLLRAPDGSEIAIRLVARAAGRRDPAIESAATAP